jgi:fatty-acyl-CoA synthase
MSERPASRTLGDLIDEMAAMRPQAEAVVFGDERLDYGTLKLWADTFAQALLASGIGKGDRVALWAPNQADWIIAALGAAKIGAIIAAISTFSTPRELGWMLRHSDASALVMAPRFRGRDFREALRAVRPRGLHTVVVLDEMEQFLERGMVVRSANVAGAQRAVQPGDICFILYTSGSTAEPKGVTLAHGPLIANAFDIGERMHLGAEDRLWLAVPLFWSFGSANAWPAILTHGGCAVLQQSFEPGEAIALIERERCSVYYGMANMARALLQHPDHPRRRLGAMRTGLTIGPPEDIRVTIEATGASQLCNVYGATETYGNCAVCDADDPLPLRLETQGLPLPGMTIRAVDPLTRAPLPPGEAGELAVRGYVTPGYFRAPERDAEAFDRDGWFLTGDLGMVGEDGRVRYRGRLKELIKTGGINVAPLEVEMVLLQHPDIAEAHVVGVPDASKGEIVAAAVALHFGTAADAGAIRAFCHERLAAYKVPARFSFRAAAELPRTPTGKIHKPKLRQEFIENGGP